MSKPPLPPDKVASPRHKSRPASKTKADVEKRTLTFLMRAYQISDVPETFKDFFETTDRSSAILLTASVERMLEFSIMARFPKQDKTTKERLVGKDGPLSSLSRKICLAFAMGIISEQLRDDLDVIRRIRNVFAHSAMRIDFTTPEIEEESKLLPKLIVISDIDEAMDGRFSSLSKPRRRFTAGCLLAWIYLFLRTMPATFWDKDRFTQDWRDQVANMMKAFNIPEHTKPA